MSASFTASLRSRPAAIRLGTGNEPLITLRVQIPEVWDTVRLELPADTPVSIIKERALQALMPDVEHPEDFVIKINGWEVLDENATLTAAGAKSGSIFLLTSRRRRPVR
ncbi:MAG: EsaB/YukD family protein [Gemmatimonadaceae bacterium]